jgi:signal recognition particle subunit SEC65
LHKFVIFHYRKYTYLYPIYFDAEKTCFEGRRLPSSLCKKNPQANDILLAVQSCGMAAELEQVRVRHDIKEIVIYFKDKSHPRSLVSSGRVKVLKSISSNKFIKTIN